LIQKSGPSDCNIAREVPATIATLCQATARLRASAIDEGAMVSSILLHSRHTAPKTRPWGMYIERFSLSGCLKSRKHCGAFAAAGGDLGAGEARTRRSAMKKLLVALTTVSAMGLYTASGAYAGNCNISLGSCNGFANGNSVSVDKNVEVNKTVKVSVGSGNGNGNVNTSGVVLGGIANGENTIQQTGNTSFSISKGKH
jgi:hypothetical protein